MAGMSKAQKMRLRKKMREGKLNKKCRYNFF